MLILLFINISYLFLNSIYFLIVYSKINSLFELVLKLFFIQLKLLKILVLKLLKKLGMIFKVHIW